MGFHISRIDCRRFVSYVPRRVRGIAFIVLFISLLFLSACGFHLRGLVNPPLWLNNVAIISNSGNLELISLLKPQLESYKIKVNPDPALAKYWLIINKMNYQQQIVSIGSSTNPRQYQLILTVEFMLQSSKGPVIVPTEVLSTTRQLTINNDRILGSNDEKLIFTREMSRDLVFQLINRLTLNYGNRSRNGVNLRKSPLPSLGEG